MSEANAQSQLKSRLLSEYGMIIVLLFLVALFSVLTYEEQFPRGRSAGEQVAGLIAENSFEGGVIIVAGPTPEDEQFVAAARETLEAKSIEVLATSAGDPRSARQAIEQALETGKLVGAIAATEISSKWSVYDNPRFESKVSGEMCVTAKPYMWPNFLKRTNLLGVGTTTAVYAIIAIGMTMVIITAGIDLSVGSLVALSAVCSALIIRDYGGGTDGSTGWVLIGYGAGVLICAAAGVFNGVMITAFRLPSFIVTLAMMRMGSGLAMRLAGGESIPELPQAFFVLGSGKLLGVPNPIWLMIVLYIIGHIVMTHTVFGRYVYAIGGNEEAARLSGVPVRRIQLAVFSISGALAGLGGIVLASRLAAGDPKFGLMYELDVITAVVVGGTSLMGGKGRIFGTLIGAFIIAVIQNGMNLMNVESFDQRIVIGAVLLVAVTLDSQKVRQLVGQVFTSSKEASGSH